MAVLTILTGDQPMLRKKTKRAPKATKEVLKLLRDMLETTVHAQGAGLAAPQIGQSLRVCIVLIGEKLIPLINPEITWKDPEIVMGEEGCLSLPNIWLQVPRHRSIVVKYIDEKGQEQERKLQNFDARVVQHEVDHLDGILITDYQEKHKTAL